MQNSDLKEKFGKLSGTRRRYAKRMRILTWNINGLRSIQDDFKERLDALDSEVICLQETKVTSKFETSKDYLSFIRKLIISGDALEGQLALLSGWSSYFAFSRKRSGYSGVATYCRSEQLGKVVLILFF